MVVLLEYRWGKLKQETEQPQQTASPFAKDLTKAPIIEAARVEEEFQISSWGSTRLRSIELYCAVARCRPAVG
jgi:hypothetical protein